MTNALKSTRGVYFNDLDGHSNDGRHDLPQFSSINDLFSTSPNHALFLDNELDQLADNGFLVLDSVFTVALLHALQQQVKQEQYYRESTVATGERIADVRGDKIRWIEDINNNITANGDPINNFTTFERIAFCSQRLAINEPAKLYLVAMYAIANWLNRHFFVGIQRCEAHFACYSKGLGYDWHVDNPKGRNERVFSAVFYLNEHWTRADGGALELIDIAGETQVILPKINRLVLFDSDLRHRVQVAQRPRYSIATWFRRDKKVVV